MRMDSYSRSRKEVVLVGRPGFTVYPQAMIAEERGFTVYLRAAKVETKETRVGGLPTGHEGRKTNFK